MTQTLPTFLSAAAITAAAASGAHAAPKTPDKVVVVILQDRASDALTTYQSAWTNLNLNFVPGGLVYTNSHGVSHPTLANTLALYSGSTHGTGLGEDEPDGFNGNGEFFSGPTLAKSLFDAGKTFSGFVEGLPADGDIDTQQAGTLAHPDLYTRRNNAMAQFNDPAPGSDTVNKTFASFPQGPGADFSQLPTVSFVIPNNLNSAHGSNLAYPWGGSPDDSLDGNNDTLRKTADAWLQAYMKPYLDWARDNNSLLVITQDEERHVGGTSSTITTLINGDDSLFEAGVNGHYFDHYNLLRTIEEMYGLPFIGESANVSAFNTNAFGVLAIPEPSALAMLLAGGLMLTGRRRGARS